MKRLLLAFVCVLTLQGQGQNVTSGAELASILNFETPQTGTMPRGWGGGPPETIFVDGEIVHGGKSAARLERNAASAQAFTTITKAVPMDFAGSTIEWR